LPEVTELRSIVERHLRAFNARDFDAWSELLHEDVEITVDSRTLCGAEAARAHAAGTLRAYPGARADLERVVAESGDAIVAEYRLVNPAGDAEGAWRLDGLVCEVFQVQDGRVAALRSYYSPTEADRTDVVHVPSRAEAARIAGEQAALRRVAELVARGVAPQEVFETVALEASGLLGGHATGLLRYDPGGDATIVAIRGGTAEVGMRVPAGSDGVAARALRTGRPARIDNYDRVPGPAAAVAREIGLRAAAGAPIVVAGRVWGLIVAMSPEVPLPGGTEDRLAQFAELVAAAIGNAESRAQLTASRARVVAAADESRRRIQRDLHDGAQQRLVQTVLTLKLARDALAGAAGPEAELVAEALDSARRATEELRELSHGLMPAALSHGGLRAGIESLARDVTLPVEVDVPAERLPPALETTAYFIVAEGLTNVVKHAGAHSARVRAVLDHGALQLEVRDDGTGGADRARGSGLVGLADRVDALGGTLTITSPPGQGTAIVVELPQARWMSR
jgi:signal transduction histidine kinase